MSNYAQGESDQFIKEETIYGYLVTEKAKKIWKVQIGLAEEVKRICEKHGIGYFIIWGTLLGAVRHKGYIPWDDDFDIGFLRNDYEKFIKVAQYEIESPLFLQTALTDRKFFFGYARLRDSRTTGIICNNNSPDYNNGIFIDLYPLDRVVDNINLRRIQFWARNTVEKICSRYYRTEKTIFHCLSYELYYSLYQWILRRGRGKNIGMVFSRDQFDQYNFDMKHLDGYMELPFEYTSFRAPRDYDSLLREVYGDYSKCPPRRKRGRWHSGQIYYDPDTSYKKYYESKK